MSEGYSGKPLWQKLGLKEGDRVAVVNAPQEYGSLVGIPVEVVSLAERPAFVHAFFKRFDEYQAWLSSACQSVPSEGVLWVSWPKKASGVPSDLDDCRVRDAALPYGIVDVKVCAVDAVWSGLKFVVRKDLRAGWNR